ncbi:MAG: indolepyruvate oxidoreductase subunit beta [Myxococcota bacterium]
MQQDLILAGVGGQGILTIAKAISLAALARGLYVKQAEVHGMSQRGGAVQSHLRFGDEPIASDIIPHGRASLVIAVEPLEALRYVQYLAPRAAIVTSVEPFVNITNYPPVEDVLHRVASYPHHILVDAERLARAAGSGRAANISVLGAASVHLELDAAELERAVAEMFAKKGDRIVEVNRRAFRFGRNAALAYVDGLSRGASSTAVRHWLDTLDPEHLAAPEPPDAPAFEVIATDDRLSGAEIHAVERTLQAVYEEGRRQLFEHEVYTIVQLVGAISPPHHIFLPIDQLLSEQALAQFPGEQVVLKIVSPDIVHKSDVRGVVFARKDHLHVTQEIERLLASHRHSADVRGVLVAEYVDRGASGLGSELFVGVRQTREFGPVIAAGLGGVDTEYLASKMKPGLAVAKAVATEITAEKFLELFASTAAYEIIAGAVRGHARLVSDGELLRCFRAFILLAQRFCVDRGPSGPDVAELEVNPFAFHKQRLVPLDGRGRLATATKKPRARPHEALARLLEPQSLAVLGVSQTSRNFGRIILENVLASGYPRAAVRLIKDGVAEIDGIACVPRIRDLERPVDLLVLAAKAQDLGGLIDEVITSGKAHSVILIPGGVGETDGSDELVTKLRDTIARGRTGENAGPIFLGPNSLGVISRPGHYDTFFIPDDKLDKRRHHPPRRVALISQSGAFIISRLSNLETLDPAIAVSLGNQLDLTVSDVTRAVGDRADIDTVGLYAEGFQDLDGLDLLRVVGDLTARGKDVIFYKAGRTEQGRSAAAGHTASVAGDYDICLAGAQQAGALVAESFREFEQLVELSAALRAKRVSGLRLGAISNAGFETVGIADSLGDPRHSLVLSDLSAASCAGLKSVLADFGLAGLVNARNPVDLTPMASEQVYEQALRVMLAAPEIDVVLVGIVPLTPALKTTARELEDGNTLVDVLVRASTTSPKPVVAIVDSGAAYEPLVRALRDAGLAVFRSADEAVRRLGQYLAHRHRRAGL